MNYHISTNIGTLKKVWQILEDVELHPVLEGKPVNIGLIALTNKLLTENKLCEACTAITESDQDFDKVSLKEAVAILSNFFVATAEDFIALVGIFSVKFGQTTQTTQADQ